MRALILSDIHANIEALDAVLEAAPAYDELWNLGDAVGYGAAPNETTGLLRSLANLSVRGNHDRACSGLLSLEEFNPIAARAAEWTRAALTAERLDWLQNLPQGPLYPGEPDVSCAHGSILNEDEYVSSLDEAWAPLRASPARLNFFGHTHLQGGFATNGEEWFELRADFPIDDEPAICEIELRRGSRYLINPGSVGQPRDHDWRAAFALYDGPREIIELHRTPYDVTRAQARIRRAGLPGFLAERLRRGR